MRVWKASPVETDGDQRVEGECPQNDVNNRADEGADRMAEAADDRDDEKLMTTSTPTENGEI